jgi:hypothetical protein
MFFCITDVYNQIEANDVQTVQVASLLRLCMLDLVIFYGKFIGVFGSSGSNNTLEVLENTPKTKPNENDKDEAHGCGLERTN